MGADSNKVDAPQNQGGSAADRLDGLLEVRLEDQLRREAEMLAARYPPTVPESGDLSAGRTFQPLGPAVHRHGQNESAGDGERTRTGSPSPVLRFRRLAAAAVLLLLVGAGALAIGLSRRPFEQAENASLVTPVARTPSADSDAHTTAVPAGAPASDGTRVQAAALREIYLPELAGLLEQSEALELVISAPDGRGGYRILATAVYVPERAEALDYRRLSSAERFAVEQLLGRGERDDEDWQI